MNPKEHKKEKILWPNPTFRCIPGQRGTSFRLSHTCADSIWERRFVM